MYFPTPVRRLVDAYRYDIHRPVEKVYCPIDKNLHADLAIRGPIDISKKSIFRPADIFTFFDPSVFRYI